jgi:hypothetical protein
MQPTLAGVMFTMSIRVYDQAGNVIETHPYGI